MLLNPAMICPTGMNQSKEKEREMLSPRSRSLLRQKDVGNPKSAYPKTKAYKLLCISLFLVFSHFQEGC